jgi:hypothetical protein
MSETYEPGDITMTSGGAIRMYTDKGYVRLDDIYWHRTVEKCPKLSSEPVIITSEQLCAALKEIYDNSIRKRSEEGA